MQLIRTSAIALLCLTSISAAQTLVTLPALKDNSMYAESGLLSNGAGTRCFAGTNFTGSIRRGLIAFDMSQIPAGSTITKVDLVLTVVMSATLNSTTVTLQAVQADWGEAASVGASGVWSP